MLNRIQQYSKRIVKKVKSLRSSKKKVQIGIFSLLVIVALPVLVLVDNQSLRYFANASFANIVLNSVTQNSNGGGSTSLLFTKPATTTSGDVLIAQVVATGPTTIITPPSGWTLIRRDNSGSSIADALYSHVVTSGEPTSYTWTFNTLQKASGGIGDFSGVNTTTPVDANSGFYNSSGSTTMSAPSVTTTTPADMLLFFGAIAKQATVTPPSGMTSKWSATTQLTTSYMANQLITTQGATGNKVGVSSIKNQSTISQLVALMPKVISPTPTTVTQPSPTPTPSSGPTTSLHYTSNGNFDVNGNFLPGAYGFNLTDAENATNVANTPAGDKALVWIGLCNGADATFTAAVQPYIGNPKVFGFYLMDEPDPTGQYKTICPQANLKAESDWIHANDPGAKTFIILMNMSSSANPTYANTYNPSNSDIDLYGLDPYPCRSELNGCDYTYVTKGVNAAEASGVPQAAIVPVYETFGGGTWVDDGGGSYLLPTAAQEQQIVSTWSSLIPSPVFDYAYSWGSQNADTSLSGSTELQQFFASYFNGTLATTPTPTLTPAPTSGTGTISFVQAKSASPGTQMASETISFVKPVNAGDLLVGWFGQYNAPGQISISDNVNGLWTRSVSETFSSSGDIALEYILHSKAAPNGLVITVSANSSTYLPYAVSEYTGFDSLAALDQTAVAFKPNSANSNQPIAGPTTSVPAGELIIGAEMTGAAPATLTVGSSGGLPFTERARNFDSASTSIEDILSGAAGPQNSSFTLSSTTDWYSVVATFKP